TKGHELYADDVPEETKKRRNNDLLAIQNKVSLAEHQRLVGETVEVLVEGPSKTALKHASSAGPLQLTGRSPSDHIVVFYGIPRLTGETVAVSIKEAMAFTLFGTVVTEERIGVAEARETGTPPKARLALPLVTGA